LLGIRLVQVPEVSDRMRSRTQIADDEGTRSAFRSWSRLRTRFRSDLVAVALFLIAVGVTMLFRWHYDNWLTEYDIFTFFLPWFGMMGDRLHDFDIPGWTPFYLSGTALAGDASAGWMYIPVMATFSILNVTTAFKTMILIQVILGGISTYVLSRVVGFLPIAALASTTAFAFGPFLSGQTNYTTIGGQVSTWIPVALLGVELSLRSPCVASRLAWWSLSGLAVSQIAVAWPGQGLVNALLIISGWILYRTVLSPPHLSQTFQPDRIIRRLTTSSGYIQTASVSPTEANERIPSRTGPSSAVSRIVMIRERLLWGVLTGITVLGGGLSLGAAGILPRLDVNAQSSIAGGDYAGLMGGEYNPPASVHHLFSQLFTDRIGFRPTNLSGVVVVLAMLALLIAIRRYCVPFFGTVWIVGMILTLHETPLHRLFYLIPQLENIHEHSPQRLLWVITLAPAMLAGATVQTIIKHPPTQYAIALVPIPLVVIGVGAQLTANEGKIGWVPYVSAIVATVLVLIVALPIRMWSKTAAAALPRYALAGLIALLFLIPTGSDMLVALLKVEPIDSPLTSDQETSGMIDLYFSRTDPGGAGEFLQAMQMRSGPFRFVAFAGRDPEPNQPSYSTRRLEPAVLAVLLNARASRLGLDLIQGYNPSHLKDYDEYFRVLNGGMQDYHWQDPYPRALGPNPLMDMLNVRYIVVDATIPAGNPEIAAIATGRRIVFRNRQVVIYENPDAFRRAWIVHDVRPEAINSLVELKSGEVDGREIAFVSGLLPNVLPAAPNVVESVRVTATNGDRLTANVTMGTPGLVVFSEVYAKGWNAYVDGKEVDIARTNHALRGIAVGTGTHVIEMRYEPRSLRIGLWITVATALGMLIVTILAVVMWFRSRIVEHAPPPPFDISSSRE